MNGKPCAHAFNDDSGKSLGMKEGKGKVSRIFQNETRGGKPYWVVAIQTGPGQFDRISAWDYNLLAGINEGDTISYKAMEKGKYSNLIEISKTEKSNVGLSDVIEYHGGGSIDQIRRMNASKTASQLLVDYKGSPEEKIKKTIEAARELEKYIMGNSEIEKTGHDASKDK